MAAIYAVYTSPNHTPVPNHLPTLIVTPHGQPSNILYSYLHTNFNSENYLLTPSPQGDLCVAKLYPPRPGTNPKASSSDPGHGAGTTGSSPRVVRCEASRNLKWSIANAGVMSPIYKLSLPSPDSADLPLFQISKPNPMAQFWSMFYFAYAGHLIPPKRIEFGRIQKNPPGPGGGGTRITISGKTPEEKAVWQTLGEGNEDCVEWVVLCAALNLLDDEILKAAEKNGPPSAAAGTPPLSAKSPAPPPNPQPQARPPPPQQHRQGLPSTGPRPPPPVTTPGAGQMRPGGGGGGGGYPQQYSNMNPAIPVPRGYTSPAPGGGGALPRGYGQAPIPPEQMRSGHSSQAQSRRI